MVGESIQYVAGRRQQAQSMGGDRWGLEAPFVHPGLVAFEQSRAKLNVLSPSEALDVAINDANVLATVSSWGPTMTRASQRRANIESLCALATQYEHDCVKNHSTATIAGFLFSCDDLVASGADSKAAGEQVNAVHVGMYLTKPKVWSGRSSFAQIWRPSPSRACGKLRWDLLTRRSRLI
jgi:hypothetical protein